MTRRISNASVDVGKCAYKKRFWDEETEEWEDEEDDEQNTIHPIRT